MKKINIFVFFIISFFVLTPTVYARDYIVLNENKYFRVTPGGAFVPGITDGVLLKDSTVDYISSSDPGYGCRNKWYKVRYNGKEGYICSSNQVITSVADVDLSGSFEQEMLNKGFTNSYLPYLKALHEKHPNWIFTAVETGIKFEDAVTNENIGDISVVDGTDESLRSKEYPYYQNGVYIETNEPGWYVASRNTVSYYMDPRNFLSEEYIFMFENLRYNRTTQTRGVVENVVAGSFLNTNEYLDIIMKTADLYEVSPVHIASRIRQEKGTTDSTATTGGEFTFSVDQECLNNLGYTDPNSWNAKNSCGSGLDYSGIYNYYNIGAYSSYWSATIRGLIWANGGFDGSVTTYRRPWKTKEDAIMGGAEYLVGKFINVNQHTLYYQKFNISPDSVYPHYTNQYMTNVRAHATEASSMYKGYTKEGNNLLNNTFEFLIPVYLEMPNDNTIIEEDKNENAGTLPEVPSIDIGEGIVSSGYKINDKYIYGINFNTSKNSINDKLKSINADLKVTEFYDKYGNKASGNVGTGDKLVISNGKTKKEYTVIIYGDSNGDGNITILDLLRCQKKILGNNNLTDNETIAVDVNFDGSINIVDLLRIRKQLLGENVIRQER